MQQNHKDPSELEYRILLGALRERSGRDLRASIEEDFRKISSGSLYTTLGRVVDYGWLKQRDATDIDGRLRFYVATGAGIKVANAAHAKFDALVKRGAALGLGGHNG